MIDKINAYFSQPLIKTLLIHIIFYCLSVLAVVLLHFSFAATALAGILFVVCEAVIIFLQKYTWDKIKTAIWQNKVLFITAGLFLARTALTMLQCYAKLDHAQSYARMGSILTLLILYGGSMFVHYMLSEDHSLEKLFLLEASVFGIVLMMIFPLYGVADEPKHMRTAYDLSNTMLMIPKTPEGIYMRKDDADFDMNYVGYNTEQIVDYVNQMAAPLESDELVLVTDKTEFAYTLEYTRRPSVIHGESYQYLFTAIGITLGRLMGVNTITMYLMGRFFNMLFYIIVMYFCIKLVPIGKILFYSIALLPMPLHMAASTSRDAFRIACPALLIALTLYLLFNEDISDKKKKILSAVLVVTGLLLFPLRRYAYAFIALFPPVVYVYKKEIISRKVLHRIFFGLCGLAVLFIIFKGFIYRGNLIPEPQLLVSKSGEPGYTKEFFFNHPLTLLRLFKNSLLIDGYWYITTMIGEYLGWLDVSYPDIFVFSLLLVLILNTIPRSYETVEMPAIFKFALFTMSVLTILLSLTGMAMTYTAMTMDTIDGIQGRYFLPVAYPLLLSFNNKSVLAHRSMDIFTICLQFITTQYILQFLLMRLF